MVEEFCKIFAKWYCHQPGIGLAHVISALNQYFELNNGFIEAFRVGVIINDPILIRAEEAFIEIIESRKAIVRLPKKVIQHVPSRQTDWAATKIDHTCGKSDVYIAQKNICKIDNLVLDVLKKLSAEWIAQLENFPGRQPCHEKRLKRLRCADDALSGIKPQPWQPGIMARLMRINKSCAYAIYESIDLFRRWTPSAEDLKNRLEAALEGVETSLKTKNEDALFEWYCALKIARVSASKGWGMDSLAKHVSVDGRFTGIYLRNEGVVLRIAKGRPRDGHEHRILEGIDDIGVRNSVLSAHGIKESGYQPDMVLTFWRTEDPSRVITYIADAKNGADSYFSLAVDKAIAYYFYFSKLFKETQNPACSLFFPRLVDHKYRRFDAEELLTNQSHPPVIALNVFDDDSSETPASIVNWFVHVSTQARDLLAEEPSNCKECKPSEILPP